MTTKDIPRDLNNLLFGVDPFESSNSNVVFDTNSKLHIFANEIKSKVMEVKSPEPSLESQDEFDKKTSQSLNLNNSLSKTSTNISEIENSETNRFETQSQMIEISNIPGVENEELEQEDDKLSNSDNSKTPCPPKMVSLELDPLKSLRLDGIQNIQSNLVKINNGHIKPQISIRIKAYDNQPSGVSYIYTNNPLPGWKKEIIIRVSGKTRGRAEVQYIHENRKLRNKTDLMTFVEKNPGFLSQIKLFEFKSTNCICHSFVSDGSRKRLKCQFGYCGCESFFHPECVGMGLKTNSQFNQLLKDSFICPFCTFYLEGTNMTNHHQFKNCKFLRDFTPGFIFQESYFKEFQILESNIPHTIWGLEDHTRFSYHYTESTQAFNFVLPQNNSLLGHNDIIHSSNLKDSETREKEYYSKEHEFSLTEEELSLPLKDQRKKVRLSSGQIVSIGIDGKYADEALVHKIDTILNKSKKLTNLNNPNSTLRKNMLEFVYSSQKSNVNRTRPRKSLQEEPDISNNSSSTSTQLLDAFVPLEDGGFRYFTTPINSFQSSLHTMCLSGYCGLCFRKVPTNSTLTSQCSKEFGILTFDFHEKCLLTIQNKLSLSSTLSKYLNYITVDQTISTLDDSHTSTDNFYHQYKSIDDKFCELCGRSGGVLISYQLNSTIVSSLPHQGNNWISHLPCLHYLLSSNLLSSEILPPLQPDIPWRKQTILLSPTISSYHPLNQELSKGNFEIFERLDDYENEDLQHISNGKSDEILASNTLDHSSIPNDKQLNLKCHPCLSIFDTIYNNHHCSLCGMNQGITLRCVALNCSVRAHPLCASMAKSWKFISLVCSKESTNDKLINGISLLCKTHSES